MRSPLFFFFSLTNVEIASDSLSVSFNLFFFGRSLSLDFTSNNVPCCWFLFTHVNVDPPNPQLWLDTFFSPYWLSIPFSFQYDLRFVRLWTPQPHTYVPQSCLTFPLFNKVTSLFFGGFPWYIFFLGLTPFNFLYFMPPPPTLMDICSSLKQPMFCICWYVIF